MKANTGKKWALLLGVVIAAAVSASAVRYVTHQRNRLRGKVTATNMMYLKDLLLEEQPRAVDPVALEALVAKRHRESILRDAWGSALVVENRPVGNSPGFLIVSLGLDGQRGKCCTRWVHDDFNADAVLEVNVTTGEDRWLQFW